MLEPERSPAVDEFDALAVAVLLLLAVVAVAAVAAYSSVTWS